MTSSPTYARAGRREWIGLAILVLPAMLVAMDMTVLHLAVPHLSADLRPGSAEMLWIVDVYGFMIAGLLIPMGTLGDRIGRRRLLLVGAAAFAVASALAALSTSPEMLIATRALLGVAGATLMPSTLALIRNMFHDPAQRTTAISLWMLGFMVGGAIGPLAGGALLEWSDWRAVFLVAVPVMVVLVAAGPALLPEYRDPHPGRLDVFSAVLSLVAVLAIIYAVKRVAEHGLGPVSGAVAAGGLAVGALFVARQRRLADPLIDLRLFAVRGFTLSLTINTVGVFVMMGTFLFVAQYLQLVVGLSPIEAGLWTLPQTAAAIAGSIVAPQLARRMRPAYVIGGGLVIAAVGFTMLAMVDGTDDLGLLVAAMVVQAIGLVPVFTLGTDLILAAAPPERAGAASGISETGSELGGALGIALLGSLGTAIYRADVDGALPATVPAEASQEIRDTLGGAVDASTRLPGEAGGAVLDTAYAAFIDGMQAVGVISAIVTATVAVLAAVLLRRLGVASAAAYALTPPSTAKR